jgi:hypothetical protein
VQLDRVLRDTFLRQEVGYLETLITLQLDDFTGFLVVDKGAVAGEFLMIVACGSWS